MTDGAKNFGINSKEIALSKQVVFNALQNGHPIICSMKKGDFTDEDIDTAKKTFISAIKAIQDEQDEEITYFISQELSGEKPDFDEYMNQINSVTKEQIQDAANKISVNTIYFLTK